GDGPEIAALGQVLSQQAVEILVAAALPRCEGIGEVALGLQNHVDQAVFGELAAVVQCERMDVIDQWMESEHDGAQGGFRLTAGHASQAREAGRALDHGHHACKARPDDGVALPVADPSALGDDRGALLDAASAEALALTRGAIAAATALAAAKVFPQGAAPATVFGNALVDALVADGHITVARDLLGTPVLAKTRLDNRPRRLTDARQRTGIVTPLSTAPLRVTGRVRAIHLAVATTLPTQGRRMAPHVARDLRERPPSLHHPLDLVPFFLAQVRIAHRCSTWR